MISILLLIPVFLFLFVIQFTNEPLDYPIKNISIPRNYDNCIFKFPRLNFQSNDTSYHNFIAVLKNGVDSANATVNDQVIFVVRKGQQFLYENYSNNAWIADGRSAYIPPDQIKQVDTSYFKFTFSKWGFIKEKDYELYEAAKRENLDLNSIFKKIQAKNGKAMIQLFNLRNSVDGASAEEFPFDFWALINLWTDKELSSFVKTLKGPTKKDFCKLLIDTTPLDKPEEYFRLYYPKTLIEIHIGKSY